MKICWRYRAGGGSTAHFHREDGARTGRRNSPDNPGMPAVVRYPTPTGRRVDELHW